MTKVSRLGICVIGTGRAGMIHARNLAFGRVDHAALAAVVDPVEKARQEAARRFDLDRVYSDYREALSDPRIGAVIVATPSEHHCAIVVAAAQAGKHILCEKPMAMNARQCDEMLAAVEKAGVPLQIGFMRRFDAGFVAAKQRIEAGEIGRVVLVKSLTYGPSIPKPWMYDIAQSNGPLSEVNSHDIDTLRWFSGSEFEEVYAIAGNTARPTPATSICDFYDNVVLSSRMRNGVQGSIWAQRRAVRVRCALRDPGRAGPDYGRQPCLRGGDHPYGSRKHNAGGAQLDRFVPGRLPGRRRRLCPLRSRGARTCAGGRDGKAAVTVVNAGNRSIAERRPVKIDAEGAVPHDCRGNHACGNLPAGRKLRRPAVPCPEARRDGVLLRVRAASICGTDVKIIRNGHRKLADGQSIILGHEFIGTIEHAGAGVEGYRLGSAWALSPTPAAAAATPVFAGRRTIAPSTRLSASTATGDMPRW